MNTHRKLQHKQSSECTGLAISTIKAHACNMQLKAIFSITYHAK